MKTAFLNIEGIKLFDQSLSGGLMLSNGVNPSNCPLSVVLMCSDVYKWEGGSARVSPVNRGHDTLLTGCNKNNKNEIN